MVTSCVSLIYILALGTNSYHSSKYVGFNKYWCEMGYISSQIYSGLLHFVMVGITICQGCKYTGVCFLTS